MKLLDWFYEVKTPTVSYQYVKEHRCSYSANTPEKDEYVYYWEGDFRTGREVKVKSVEILRQILNEKDYQIIELQYEIDELKGK